MINHLKKKLRLLYSKFSPTWKISRSLQSNPNFCEPKSSKNSASTKQKFALFKNSQVRIHISVYDIHYQCTGIWGFPCLIDQAETLGNFFFSFKYITHSHKKIYTNFHIKKKNSGSNGRSCRFGTDALSILFEFTP